MRIPTASTAYVRRQVDNSSLLILALKIEQMLHISLVSRTAPRTTVLPPEYSKMPFIQIELQVEA